MDRFPAKLGHKERLLTWGVGYGVGFGVPIILGVSFAIGFEEPRMLLFPLPFVIAFGTPCFFRPRSFEVSVDRVGISRIAGVLHIPLREVRAARYPATRPAATVIGIARVDGMHGTFGTFRSRDWGRFRMYVTDHDKMVELRLSDGSRVIVSPNDPTGFLAALERTAQLAGAHIEVMSD